MLLIWSRSSAISRSTASRSMQRAGAKPSDFAPCSLASAFLQFNAVVLLHSLAKRLPFVAQSSRDHFHLVLLSLQSGKLLTPGSNLSTSAARSRRMPSSATACTANCSACRCLLADNSASVCRVGTHSFVELDDLRFTGCKLPAHLSQ